MFSHNFSSEFHYLSMASVTRGTTQLRAPCHDSGSSEMLTMQCPADNWWVYHTPVVTSEWPPCSGCNYLSWVRAVVSRVICYPRSEHIGSDSEVHIYSRELFISDLTVAQGSQMRFQQPENVCLNGFMTLEKLSKYCWVQNFTMFPHSSSLFAVYQWSMYS